MPETTPTARRMIGGRMVDVPMTAAEAIHPTAPAVAELVELVEQNMGADRLVVDAADFFTDPGGVLGYLLGPDRNATTSHEAAREAFRVIARRHANDLTDCGEAARHYLATGQAWAGTLTVPPAPPAPSTAGAPEVAELLRGLRSLADAYEAAADSAKPGLDRARHSARSVAFRQAQRLAAAYLREGSGPFALGELLPYPGRDPFALD